MQTSIVRDMQPTAWAMAWPTAMHGSMFTNLTVHNEAHSTYGVIMAADVFGPSQIKKHCECKPLNSRQTHLFWAFLSVSHWKVNNICIYINSEKCQQHIINIPIWENINCFVYIRFLVIIHGEYTKSYAGFWFKLICQSTYTSGQTHNCCTSQWCMLQAKIVSEKIFCNIHFLHN